MRTFFSKTTGQSIRVENKSERSRCNTSADAQSSCGRSDGQPAKKRGMCPSQTYAAAAMAPAC